MRTLAVGVLAFLAGGWLAVQGGAASSWAGECPDAALALEAAESLCERVDALEARPDGPSRPVAAPGHSSSPAWLWWWWLAAVGLVGILGLGALAFGLPERTACLIRQLRGEPDPDEGPKYLAAHRHGDDT